MIINKRVCPVCGEIDKRTGPTILAQLNKAQDSAYEKHVNGNSDDMPYYAGICDGIDIAKKMIRTHIAGQALRPLSWEEIPDHRLVYLELRGIDKPVPSILRQTMDDQAWYTMESGCVFTFAMDELGKRWRPWASEPTEAERSAAEWM